MDYLRYYIAAALQAVGFAGFFLGGQWVWLGIATFPLLATIDALLPNDMAPRRMRGGFAAYLPVWIAAFGGLGLYAAAALWIAREPAAGPLQIAGAILSLGWLSVVPMVPVTHELYHQRNKFSRFLGRFSQIVYLDSTRDVAHVVGHHIDVATVRDGDTARRGVNLYAFTAKAILVSTRESLRMEADLLEKQGKSRWSISHRLYRALLALIVVQGVIYAIGGWPAVGITLAAMLLGRAWAESFNYFQHYGLMRAVGSPISRRHVWNHLKPISRALSFEITNHADHHTDTFAPYYALVPDRQWVPMPSVFVCFVSALIPPLWEAAIAKPALRRWDNELASAEERDMARAANKAAGWPDWFGDDRKEERMAAA